MDDPLIAVTRLTHYYGNRRALNNISFNIGQGEIFGFLGPNGGGKTTMFKILSTADVPSLGTARVCGYDVVADPAEVRKRIGVVFQSPSLDTKLTVSENLRFHGFFYGLFGSEAEARIDEVMVRLGLQDRSRDIVETLSGGLRRRVEIAKGLLHRPQLLLLDEPSTGLDPVARREVWRYLQHLRGEGKTTIVVTSHILEEADDCDRLAILDRGSLVALGTPEALKREVGSEVITIVAKEPGEMPGLLKKKFKLNSTLVGNMVRVERNNGHQFVPRIVEAFPGKIDAVSVAKPTLEDVFIHNTGHAMLNGAPNEISPAKSMS